MSDNTHRDCYGRMFPQTLHLDSNKWIGGKVFAFQLVTAGSTFRSDRRVKADLEAWDQCIECPEFEHCYRLSVGKLLLETAIGDK